MIFKPMTEDAEWDWIYERARPLRVIDSQGLVVYENGDIQAAAVFDSFTTDSCSVHFAIDNPFVIRHGFLHEIARHLFDECACVRIFGLVPGNNDKALKLDKHIGFTEVARIPHGYQSGVDYVVMCMEKADCRWLQQEMRKAA